MTVNAHNTLLYDPPFKNAYIMISGVAPTPAVRLPVQYLPKFITEYDWQSAETL